MAATAIHYTPGAQITVKAGAQLQAGSLVKIDGAWDDRRNLKANYPSAKDVVFGFIRRDVEADEYVTVYRGKYIADMRTEGAIKAGQPVTIGKTGAVKAASAGLEGGAADAVVGVAAEDKRKDEFVAVAFQ